MNFEKSYTVKETADILKISTRTIMTYLYSGKLKGSKIGAKWLIPLSSIKKLIADNQNTVK